MIEDFLPHLGKGNFFSKLDIKNAFHQVEISEQSREILCDCDGCLNFIDDIIVHGSSRDKHDKRLRKVLDALKRSDVSLNREKCIYGVQTLQFLGHELSAEGIKPNKEKVSAVKNFREPETPEEVRSFLGLVNYVGKFIPDLATTTEPLRKLTKKGTKFDWKEEQRKAFKNLKGQLSENATLGYYDVNDKTELVADASPVGLGAVLIQKNASGSRIISYASKSLSDVERRYCQTEKEALALVWAIERSHFYLFGRQFDLITDHKPLEVIFGPRSKPCARIERWVLRIQSYQYNVVYRPGKSNIADPLSRLSITQSRKYKLYK